MKQFEITTNTTTTTIEKEDATMKTAINLSDATATFELNNTTYTYHIESRRYSKTVDGKVKRIGKAEYEAAKAEYDQMVLDSQPSRVDEETEKVEETKKTEKVEETKKTEKVRKPRRSKDIAYEGHGVTLTAKQVDFILHIADTCFWVPGDFSSGVFVDCLCDEIKGQFEGKPMTVGAMISTLCEKGLGGRCKDDSRQGKPTVFSFSKLGAEVAKEVGLK